MQVNRHGLSRRIPNGIKRNIRKNSGFGCVICGFAIYQYEHVDPEFANATSHNPKKMTLLCGTCHDQVTRGIYSKENVKEAMNNPKCMQKGFTRGVFDIGDTMPSIQFGDSIFTSLNGLVLLEIEGEDILKFEPPEIAGGAFLLSASFYGEDESINFSINQNEWMGDINSWDIEIEGQRITIRQKEKSTLLELISIPRERIVISKIDMQYKGYKIFGNETIGFSLYNSDGSSLNFKSCTFVYANKTMRNVVFQLGKLYNPSSSALFKLI